MSISPPAFLEAGAAVTDLTPRGSMFLFGYPHVPRTSTGVHDPLQCAALYLRSEVAAAKGEALFLANDLIHVSKRLVADVRRGISEETGVPEGAIMITTTHTHSGPVMVDHVSNAADPTVPKADPEYLAFVTGQMIAAGCAAVRANQPAQIGFTIARAQGVGTNRHDPAGPADPDVPVLLVRERAGGASIAAMLVYAMHPTVLHEDSTLISGDFPYFTRRYVQQHVLKADVPVLYHNGASGNQSPRHVTRANTFAEAQRLGELLGRSIADAVARAEWLEQVPVGVAQSSLELTARRMPARPQAQRALAEARDRFERLKREGAARTAVRTAECDVFGAEETAELASGAEDGRLEAAVRACLPAEVQVVRVGPWSFAGWPGEFFVEYALELRKRAPGTFVMTLANGELQGYIVTPEADAKGVYEARNALFSHENGPRVLAETLRLITGGPSH